MIKNVDDGETREKGERERGEKIRQNSERHTNTATHWSTPKSKYFLEGSVHIYHIVKKGTFPCH